MVSPNNEGGLAALQRLKSVDPPLFLSPSPSLSKTARTASEYIFSSLHPFCPKSPFDTLLLEGFDAEQIWQQIDLQTKALVPNLRRDVKRFEKNPEEISKLFGGKVVKKDADKKYDVVVDEESEDFDEENEEDEGFEDLEGEEETGGTDEDDEDEEAEEDDEDEEEDGNDGGGGGGIEDKFLKIKELEEYMEDDEAREYGVSKEKQRVPKDDNEDEDEEEDDDEDDEIGGFGVDGDEDEGVDKFRNARYEDFFGGEKKKSSKRKSRSLDGSEDMDTDDEQEDDKGFPDQNGETLSTHERKAEQLRSKIEQMEKANMEPKTWTMQGEVTATKRPKNSALEVDLDFEHNVRPAPVITEEVTASLEDIIKKRISEGHFDDVQKAPSMPSKAPKEIKELDENKSKKGLAEIYEEDYVQKTGLASAPLSFSDEQKKGASLLFKKLCLKLDALSHFHFTPKPIIEDMSVQANVPALAMEEIAPLAVSDAAMLAPEEVFTGKGDIKEDAELTQADRKRRRANKKRKFKAKTEKRMEKKPQDSTLVNHSNGKEEQ